MAEIQHQLKMGAARPKILEALTTLAALERWNGARVSGGPQEWTVAYQNGATFRWKVIAATNDQVTWHCEDGPGNAKGSELSFAFSDTDKGGTLVRLVHRERAGSDPNHQKCNTLWGVLLGRLQQEAEGFQVTKRQVEV
ncbi:MAG TPA: hypothetical protein VHZ55_30725 [Bryobacteraceae bacterium]|jgi:uncharacterized protein YndB with AHSA1/START domain|nr:hypothetical protein [Bryobacteraceae bacterium]